MGARKIRVMVGIICVTAMCMVFAGLASAAAADQKFVAHDAEIPGAKIHYTTGGHGPVVILLHGYA